MNDQTIQIVFDAGKASAKASANIRKTNATVAEALKLLNLNMADDTGKAILETYRIEYMTGAFASEHNVEQARDLATGKGERGASDKAIANAARVNWLHIREYAGLKDKPKARATQTTATEPPRSVRDITSTHVSDAAEFLNVFNAAYVALLKTIDASSAKLTGDAAAILRAAIVDMGDASREAALALKAAAAEPEKMAA